VKRGSILIVGAGRLGKALALRLTEAGYTVTKIASRCSRLPGRLATDIVWFCVPDGEIARAAKNYSKLNWDGKAAFHSSGVLSSDALDRLRKAGAVVASVHPLMTFVAGSAPELFGVPFAIEGDERAIGVARRVVRDLGGAAFVIEKRAKVAYHAFATMICPLLVALLAASERVAGLAGIGRQQARRRMAPIIRQTLLNYERLGPTGAFSGPIVRGDVETIREHLNAITNLPKAKNAYVGLVWAALQFLPSRNPAKIKQLLATRTKAFNRRVRQGGARSQSQHH
jgi:predicted short-subunit dehydrogenase-like oxidoreductase (DUF2520 family)